MKIKNLLLCICFFFVANTSFADSPLTSTDFHMGYIDIAIIKQASKSDGIITEKQLQFLTNAKNPIAIKLALINSLGWETKGKCNTTKYIVYLLKKETQLNYKNFYNKATSDQLICYAYLKAMDDYFNVKSAGVFARQAMRKAPTTYSIHLIGTLIQVQGLNQNNWCSVYTKINQVQTNNKLQLDMRLLSTAAIFSYTDGYKEYCK
jgi:PDZ domain-containing secreted protein